MLTNLVTFAIINPPEKNTVMHGGFLQQSLQQSYIAETEMFQKHIRVVRP